MAYEPGRDARLDPRCRQFLAHLPVPVSRGDVRTPEELLAEAASDEGLAAERFWRELFDSFDDEDAAPREGLRIEDYEAVSSPDGTTINLQLTRPDSRATLACVYYLHGGGMSSGSCYFGAYQAWSRMLAHQGVAVVLVDFRNSIVASSVQEVAPYPAGLDDCQSGLGWIHEHAGTLGGTGQGWWSRE